MIPEDFSVLPRRDLPLPVLTACCANPSPQLFRDESGKIILICMNCSAIVG